MGKKPLMTYNNTSSRNPTCVSLPFLNQFVDEKNPDIALGTWALNWMPEIQVQVQAI